MSQSKLASALKTYSVLPDNYSPLERALELSLNQQLANIKHPYPNLLDAFSSSMDVVPAIAAERLVPVWESSDSDEVKRARANNAWIFRKTAGTRQGLIKSINDLGFNCVVTPWFKMTPQGAPYTFSIWAYCLDQVLTEEIDHRLDALILEMKSERDVHELYLARASENKNYMGVSCEVGITMTSEPFVLSSREFQSAEYKGVGVHTRETATSEPAIQ